MISFKSINASDSISIDENLYEKIQECCYNEGIELEEGEIDFTTSSLLAKIIQINLPNTDELLDIIYICECGGIKIDYL